MHWAQTTSNFLKTFYLRPVHILHLFDVKQLNYLDVVCLYHRCSIEPMLSSRTKNWTNLIISSMCICVSSIINVHLMMNGTGVMRFYKNIHYISIRHLSNQFWPHHKINDVYMVSKFGECEDLILNSSLWTSSPLISIYI